MRVEATSSQRDADTLLKLRIYEQNRIERFYTYIVLRCLEYDKNI